MTRNCFNLLTVILLLMHPASAVYAQSSKGNCGRTTEILYTFLDYSMLSSGGDKTAFEEKSVEEQYQKLSKLDEFILNELTSNGSYQIIPVALKLEQELSGNKFLKNQHKYIIYGFVRLNISDEYQLHLFLKPTCSEKNLAETEVFYPLNNSWSPALIAKQAVTKLTSLINISEFEENERDQKNYGLGGDLWGGRIIINIDKALAKGTETQVQIKVVDCDGRNLNNKEISTEGTTGGRFTPAKFITNATGVATTKFKMTSDKGAIVKASSETKNVLGCQDLYTGTEIVTSGKYMKVDITYNKSVHTEFKMQAKDSLFSINLGNESSIGNVSNKATIYFKMPARQNKEHKFTISEDEKSTDAIVAYNYGASEWRKTLKAPEMSVIPLGSTHKEGIDSVESIYSSYFFDPVTPQMDIQFKNDNLYSFDVDFNFKDQDDGRIPLSGGFLAIEGDKTSKIIARKITDPKSPYKMEYTIKYSELTKVSQPTGGTYERQEATVKILSPF